MHQYRLDVYRYSEAGVLENRPFMQKELDTPYQVAKAMEEYTDKYYMLESIDDDGNVTMVNTGIKMYKCKVYTAIFSEIDIAAFKAMYNL